MSSSEQPVRYPRWATTGDIDEPSEGQKDTGFEDEQEADAQTINWLLHTTNDWLQHLDERAVGPELVGRDATWVEPTLGYTGAAGAGLLTATPGVVWLDGRRLEFSAAYLAGQGIAEKTFVVPSRTFVAVNEAREIEFIDRPVGDATVPTPTAGFTVVYRLDVSAGAPPAVTYILPIAPTLVGPLEIEGDVTIDGDLVVEGNVTGRRWMNARPIAATGTPPVLDLAGTGFGYAGADPVFESYVFSRRVTSAAASFELLRLHPGDWASTILVQYHVMWWDQSIPNVIEYVRGHGVARTTGTVDQAATVSTGVIGAGLADVTAPSLYSPDGTALALQGNHGGVSQTINYAGHIQIARFNWNQ